MTAHPAYGVARPVTEHATVLLADNPSPLTLDGTNTWVLRGPEAGSCVVVDPGPDDEGHLRRAAAQGPVAEVLLTHRHPDHAAGARRFAELTGATVRALDPAHRIGRQGLADGDVLVRAGVRIEVLATPGHTADSVCLLVTGAGGAAGAQASAVLTGDTVLGRGTTVIAEPDGRLGQYLDSLHRLAALAPGMPVLPGHGPDLADTAQTARAYLDHREQRLAQVRAALQRLGEPADRAGSRAVVELVYADVDPELWPAAEQSVRAQLDYLAGLE